MVSEPSEAEPSKEQAEEAKLLTKQEVESAFRVLAANLMRITRGAGLPHESPERADRLIKAYLAYKEAIGHWPTAYEANNALKLYPGDQTSGLSDEQLDNRSAMEQIVHGALQVAASTLLDQPLQISRGHNEIDQGISLRERLRDERRKKWLE